MKCALLPSLALASSFVFSACSGPSGADEHASASSREALSAGGTPLFKLVLQRDKILDHFYTTDWNEVMSAQALGYLDFGPVGRCFTTQIAGTVPLFRLYSNAQVDHFYTTSEYEAENAVRQYGYAREGIACFVFVDNATGTCPLLRYVFDGRGVASMVDHFYTESAREGALAVQYGYQYEGIAAFLSPYGDTCPQ